MLHCYVIFSSLICPGDYPIMVYKSVCQGGSLGIDCPTGHIIKIDYALYGRVHGSAVCNSQHLLDFNCKAENALSVSGQNKCYELLYSNSADQFHYFVGLQHQRSREKHVCISRGSKFMVRLTAENWRLRSGEN